MRRLVSLFVAVVVAVTVSAAAAHVARAEKAAPAALHGYCPVAYSMSKAMKGNPKLSSVVDGHRYHFCDADAKRMFDADPSKYQVAYDGNCAAACSMGKRMPSNPRLFSVYKGKTYLFSSAAAKKSFDAMPDAMIAKADAAWPGLAGK